MRPQDRITIGWCDPGEVDGGFAAAMMRLGWERGGRLADQPLIRMVGSGLLSRTRNQLVATFLDRTASDWLLMIDTDEVLTLPTFDRLTEAATYHRPVVSGLVFGAYPGDLYPTPRPSIFRLEGDRHQPLVDFPRDTLIPVDAAGTGCLLVHRRVLESVRQSADQQTRDWAWFQDGPMPDGRWISEDLTFCARIRAAGFPIHAHTGAVLPHRKSYWLGLDHFDAWRATNVEQE